MQRITDVLDRLKPTSQRLVENSPWQWLIRPCCILITLFLIAVIIVISLIPTYLSPRDVDNTNSITPIIIVNYGTNVKDTASLTIANTRTIANNLMKKYHLYNTVVIDARFYQSSATCYPNQLTKHENVRTCQQRTNTAGSMFVTTFTTRYPAGCHTVSCHQQYLSKISTNIETIYSKINLLMTFTNGQTHDVALIFCSFGLGDTGSAICTDRRQSTKISSQISTLNGIDYYIPSYSIASLPFATDTQCLIQLDLVPITVVHGTLTKDTLYSILNKWSLGDDVISNEFFAGFFFPDVTSFAMSLLVNNLTTTSDVLLLSYTVESSPIDGVIYLARTGITVPNGPYFVSSNCTHIQFYQVYRLYRDYTNSFMYGIVPTKNGIYETVHANILNDNTPTIAVPSRLYYTTTEQQPLAGIRIAVKDTYDIIGTKTGGGNRAYFELYPVVNKTAFSIQRLIDQGAILVGKVKTAQFANGETATADWVDYQCPFNPRGDGYQQPEVSSSGSGASIAAYNWLDIALGTDTGGSVREPAGHQGLYGIRPSHGAISLDGVIPLCSVLDTAGFLVRDAISLNTFAKVWYADRFISYSKFPTKILYSIEFLSQPSIVTEIFENFTRQLVNFLGSNGTILFNISSAFETSNITNTSLEIYYYETYISLISHYQYYNLGINFINNYKSVYNERTPFINPIPMARWQYGYLNVTNTSYENHLFRKNQFSNWWNSIIQPANSLTCSENIFIYPVSNATPSYRNQYIPPAKPNFGFETVYISSFASNPDITIPIGQASYYSTITLQTEYLPVTMGIMAHRGCDYMLLELIKQLHHVGIVQEVKTGRMTF